MNDKIKAFLRPAARWAVRTRAFKYYQDASGDPRYLYLPLTWFLARLLVPRRRVRLGKVTFTLQCDNEITHFRWFLFGRKEPEIVQFVDTHLAPDGLLLDIGANIGVFTLYASKRHAGLRVISVEPEYSNLHYLKENILRNGLADRVRIFGLAAADRDGLSTLHLQDTTPGAAVHTESSTAIDRTAEGYDVVWKEGIATATVDTICAAYGETPTALKIDTDGNELKVLSGAGKALADPRLRAIAIEMPPSADDTARCRDILHGHGFAVTWSHESTRNEIWTRTGPA